MATIECRGGTTQRRTVHGSMMPEFKQLVWVGVDGYLPGCDWRPGRQFARLHAGYTNGKYCVSVIEWAVKVAARVGLLPIPGARTFEECKEFAQRVYEEWQLHAIREALLDAEVI